LLFGNLEVLAECFVVDASDNVGDHNGHTVLLTAVLAFAVCVGNFVFEGLDLSGKSFLFTIQHCELVDRAEQ